MFFAPRIRISAREIATRMVLATAMTLACGSVQAHDTATVVSPAPTLAQSINAYIAQPQFAHADWGIAVRSLDTGKVLYQHNADRLFVPASNTKLFTAALALATLGSNTRIATTLYATSTRIHAHGTLHGDLILYGRGDPSLGLKNASPKWADRLAAALAQRGIKRVRGNLIADATYFTGSPTGNGWEADDLQSWYGATPSALDVAGNLVRVEVAREGHHCCSLTLTPDATGIHIDNLTSNDHGPGNPPFGLYRPVGSSTLYAINQLPPHVHRHRYVLSMPDPALAAGNLLRAAMQRAGIKLTGKVIALHWPQTDPALTQPGTQAIAHIDSPPVAQLVDHMLKHSDNLFAQSLLLQVGVAAAQRNHCELSRPPDTSNAWALCALRDLLAQAGIPPSTALLAEGSGLSRRDLVTPNAFVQWLTWAMRQPWAVDLRAALPVAGVDGTLEHRFKDGPATDNLQAKTGTLNHVYALTGFVTDAAGQHLVFSILLNRYPRWEIALEYPHAPPPDDALDDIARMITQAGAH